MVKYGTDKADRTAFTKNVSVTGLQLQTNHVFPPGTTLQLEIHMPEKVVGMWARVAWAKRVPPQLAHVLECGMGLSFVEEDPDWPNCFEQWQKG